MLHTFQAATRLAALLFISSATLTASAQLTTKARTFSTPDLQAFEVKGHVKEITWTWSFSADIPDDVMFVDFLVDGNVNVDHYFIEDDEKGMQLTTDEDEADISVAGNFPFRCDDEGKIIALYTEILEEGDFEREGSYNTLSWDGNRLVGLSSHAKWMEYETTLDAEGNSKRVKETDGVEGTVKYTDYKYVSYDKCGNWTKRSHGDVVETREIEYYEFEDEYNALVDGGSLADIESLMGKAEEAEEYTLKTALEELWNRRAMEICGVSRNITRDAETILGSALATESTRQFVSDVWNSNYNARLQQDGEPTDLVNEILKSSLATEALKTNARNRWNEYYKSAVERSDNPTATAAAIIDNPLLADDYRNYIFAHVHNYELEHHVNGVTDYNALYRAAEVKCGPHYVFNDEERKKIVFNADQYKRQATNALIVRSQQLMNDLKLDESRECALQALAIEPTYATAREQRAEVEYRILWGHIMTVSATPEMIATYSRNNPESRYNHDLELVSTILLHLDHKCSAPRKLYKKMLKYHGIPEEAKVIKVVQKCMKKDAK